MSKRSIDAVDGPAVREEAEIKRPRRDTFLRLAGSATDVPDYMHNTPTIITAPPVSVSLSDRQYGLQRLMQDLDPRLHIGLNPGEVKRINRIRVDLITAWGTEMNPLLVQAWKTYLDTAPRFEPRVRADALDQPMVDYYIHRDIAMPTVTRNTQSARLDLKEGCWPLLGYTMKQYMLEEAMEELDGVVLVRDGISKEVHAAIDALRRELIEVLGADMHPVLVEQWKKFLHM